MAERNKHPEIDIQTPVRALIGAEPISAPEPAEEVRRAEVDGDTLLPQQLPVLDIPTIVRAFQTDAYPRPDDAPLQIAVGKETSLTLYPKDEALEYRQQTPEHTIYLRASKAGEVAFTWTPTPRVSATQEPPPALPQGSLPETVPVGDEVPLPAAGEPGDPAEKPEATTHPSRDFPDQADFPGHGPFWDAVNYKIAC
jgi:hypothetical protein